MKLPQDEVIPAAGPGPQGLHGPLASSQQHSSNPAWLRAPPPSWFGPPDSAALCLLLQEAPNTGPGWPLEPHASQRHSQAGWPSLLLRGGPPLRLLLCPFVVHARGRAGPNPPSTTHKGRPRLPGRVSEAVSAAGLGHGAPAEGGPTAPSPLSRAWAFGVSRLLCPSPTQAGLLDLEGLVTEVVELPLCGALPQASPSRSPQTL